MGPHERRSGDTRLDRIEKAIERIQESQRVASHRNSLIKNGETWWQYIGKVFTVDRILLLIVLIYQIGGRVQYYTSRLDDVQKQQELVAKQHEAVVEQMRNTLTLQQQLAEAVEIQKSETARLSQVSRQLNDRISLTVTRREFERALAERISQPLNRIERAITDK